MDRADRWTACMRRADFEGAWRVSDEVLRAHAGVDCSGRPRHLQFVWRGEPLDGKRVLLRCYHGLGDTIQFIRYAPLVKAIAREVTVWAQPELLPLLRAARGIDRLLPLHDGAPECDYDAEAELSELPHVFRTSGATIPADVPYLHVEPAALAREGSMHVGIVWGAGGWDERRSVPFELVQPLADVPGVTIHVLQRGPSLADRPDGWGLLSASDDCLRAARVIRALDLVISVDTMPAHLAGALATPVWTLLHADPDWRWMLRRDDSPWYPTMRLFRQSRTGGWAGPLARVRAELRDLAARRRHEAAFAPASAPTRNPPPTDSRRPARRGCLSARLR